jgi:Dolichyl-phosphate-mannose-protein mannosyltransferase
MTCEASVSDKIGRRNMAARCWIPLSILGCAFLFLIATMDRFAYPYDEGLILVGATRVLSDDIPYRDFYSIYGPGQFYVLAALFKVFGPSVLVERLWDFLVRSCVVLVIYLIVGRAWSRWRALFAAVLTYIWLSYFGNYGYPVFPCLLFSLLSVYCVVPVYDGSRAIAPLLVSGLCVGITILFRHDIGIATALGGALTLGLFHWTQKLATRQKIKVLLRSAAIYTGGIALAVVPPLALLVTAGAAQDMLLDLVLLPAKTYVRMRSLPFPSVIAIARDASHGKLGSLDQLAIYLPIVAVLLGVIAASALGGNQRSATSADEQALISQRRWILVQLSVFSLLFFFKGWVRVSLIHMALSIVPALVIMITWELRARAAKILFGVGIVCLLLISLQPMRTAFWQFEKNWIWAAQSSGVFGIARSDSGTCFPPAGLERLRCFHIPRDREAAIRYVQEHTAENESIFVGLTRHDKTFCNDILFYFLSKRPSVTKWHEFDPGVQTTVEIQTEMVGELEMRRPRYAVLSSEWDNIQEPNESSPGSGVTILDQFIHANYYIVAAFGPIKILEHRPR